MSAYYNEIDPAAAHVLRALIAAALKDDLDGNRPLCLNEVDLFA